MKVFGIDQTGATLSDIKAKPLKACELVLDDNRMLRDAIFFEISHLGQWVRTLDKNEINHVFIDCVFGLPIELHHLNPCFSIRDWIEKSKHFNIDGKNYGRNIAKEFFNRILDFYDLKNSSPPRREIETLLNSNSVFATHPFQQNIQTGTFRIWKELSECLDEILIWPFDFYLQQELKTIFYEVYPSYFYKKILKVRSRSKEAVLNWAKDSGLRLSPEVIKQLNNPDSCDAFVAAIGGLQSLKTKKLWSIDNPNSFFEGHILGF